MATKYFVSGGNGDWSHSSNWSLTSGGPSGTGAPNSSDDAIIDANSLNAPLNVNVASQANSVYMSGYTGLMTYESTLNCHQDFTYSSGMTVASTSLTANGLLLGSASFAAATVTFNGVYHNAFFSFNNSTRAITTYTIVDELNIGGTTAFQNSNASGAGTKATVDGGNIYCYGGFTIYTNGNRWVGGTSDLYFVGGNSGNFASGVSAFILKPIIFVKTGGTLNMTTGALYPRATTVTYISGNFTNFLLSCSVGSNTLETSGMTWSSVSLLGSGSMILNSQLNVSGTFSNTIASSIGGTGGINCGNLTTTGNLLFPTGSTTNISGTLTSTGTAAAPITIGTVSVGSRANMILNYNGNQDVSHTNGRDIDSDGGLTIMSYKAASISNCDNWTTLPIITSNNKNVFLR